MLETSYREKETSFIDFIDMLLIVLFSFAYFSILSVRHHKHCLNEILKVSYPFSASFLFLILFSYCIFLASVSLFYPLTPPIFTFVLGSMFLKLMEKYPQLMKQHQIMKGCLTGFVKNSSLPYSLHAL